MSLTTQFLNIASLLPLAQADLNADDVAPRSALGTTGIYLDNFGLRMFRYVKNVRGSALGFGEVAIRVADITVASITSGTTTSITKTAGFTANANVGKILVYETNNTTPGAAPEGQSALITANTADVLTLDANLPLSAAPNAADSIRIRAPWHADAAGAAALAVDVLGVVVGSGGITNGNFGWLQFQGYCPLTAVTAAAIAAGATVITGATAKVKTIGAGAANTAVGYAAGATAATNAGKAPVILTLGALGAPSL